MLIISTSNSNITSEVHKSIHPYRVTFIPIRIRFFETCLNRMIIIISIRTTIWIVKIGRRFSAYPLVNNCRQETAVWFYRIFCILLIIIFIVLVRILDYPKTFIRATSRKRCMIGNTKVTEFIQFFFLILITTNKAGYTKAKYTYVQ